MANKIYYLPVLIILFCLPLASQAYAVKTDNFIYIAKDEVVEGNLYFGANSLNIEGKVLGDVIGLAANIKINGEISGDLIVVSQNLNLNGKVSGNLRGLANVINVNGQVGKNATVFSESLILGSESLIGQDLLLSSLYSEFNGRIGSNLHGYSDQAVLRGEIGQDVNLKLDSQKKKKYTNKLQIDQSALINGSLNYQAGHEAQISSENIKGEVRRQEPKKKEKTSQSLEKFSLNFFSLLLAAYLINYLFKNKINSLKDIIIKPDGRLPLYGLALLILTPLASLLLILSLIGLPLALIILALWLILIFVSQVISAIALGHYLFKVSKKEKIDKRIKIAAGVFILCLLSSIPYLGWLFSLSAIIIGLGAVYLLFKTKKHEHQSFNF